MRKGLLLTLMIGLAMAGNVANAAAPVIEDIPVIVISDLESHVGSTDNNLFEFNDAFGAETFDDYVADPDTADADLLWSFDYDPSLTGNVGTITINGLARLDVGGTGDPNAPGALELRAASTNPDYRETTLSPTAGSIPFPNPTGTNGTIPGIAGTVEIAGDLAVTYYVSDGTAFDSSDSFVFSVDNDPGETTPDTLVPPGVPTLPFTPVSLTGWTFSDSDGNFLADGATSGTTGGLQITLPQAASAGDPAIIDFYYGLWLNGSLPEFAVADNLAYAWRATLAANQPCDLTSGNRLQVQSFAGGMDYAYNVNETDPTSPFAVGATAKAYLAYLVPPTEEVNETKLAVFDNTDDGNTAGVRTTTMSQLEASSDDPTAFLGAENAIADGTFASGAFTGWTWLLINDFSGGLLGWDSSGTSSGTAGGNLQITDDDGTTGGVALWTYRVADGWEMDAGALYRSIMNVSADDGSGDSTFPRFLMSVRTEDPSLSSEIAIRGNTALLTTIGDGVAEPYENWFVAPGFNGTPGAGNLADDLTMEFALYNLTTGLPNGRGGTLELSGTTNSELSSDDPNVP